MQKIIFRFSYASHLHSPQLLGSHFFISPLQPFFVLRKAFPRKPGSRKTRKKVDLPPVSPKTGDIQSPNDGENRLYEQLRVEAFGLVWSKIETAAKNIEFVDDILTFEELGAHLKSQECHVANLSSTDFSVKNGIGGCVRGLLRQLTAVNLDAADVAILAAWYSELENCDHPVVIIIDDLERCNGTVLAEFIVLLSEWVVQIPIILIAGVSTTTNASTKLLPSNALQCLNPCKFTLGLPTERMDAIIEHVLVKQYSGFGVGHEIAVFLRKYFLKHDGTVASFIRALKVTWEKKCEMLPEEMLKYAFNLPSCQREGFIEMTGETLAHGLLELNKLRRNWSSVVMAFPISDTLQRSPTAVRNEQGLLGRFPRSNALYRNPGVVRNKEKYGISGYYEKKKNQFF
ncbi:Origin recognition complex subunit 3 [Asimina triloba]